MGWWAAMVAHGSTIAPRVRHAIKPYASPPSEPWQTQIQGDRSLRVTLSGQRTTLPGGKRSLALLIHGLGGTAQSHYMCRSAKSLVDQGMDCLRLNLRGMGESSPDLYHAGLTADLHQLFRNPWIQAYERVLVLGFSLGGHMALKFATEKPPSQVKAVAAMCAPLDLAACAQWIDRPGCWLYRSYVMRSLKQAYERMLGHPDCHLPHVPVGGIDTIQAWDDALVAPRFGFRNAREYYTCQSAGPRLHELRVPAFLIHAPHDPMVPALSVRPFLNASPRIHSAWMRHGGHVSFPSKFQQGFSPEPGIMAQITGWFDSLISREQDQDQRSCPH